jgi:DUF1680 family protein
MMWNHRMFLLTGESKYMDVLERTCFNGFISGVALSGDRFFYPNPLVYDGKSKFNHDIAGRAPWFGCACCPPNLMRTTAAITGYFYAVRDRSLYVNFFGQSDCEVDVAGTKVNVRQETNYPWSGKIKVTLAASQPTAFDLRVRIPGWTQGAPVPSDLYSYEDSAPAAWTVKVGGAKTDVRLEHGYAVLSRTWKTGDVIELDLPMPVRRVHGNSKIAATTGRSAFERGPILYCFEGSDSKVAPAEIGFTRDVSVRETTKPDLLGGVAVLQFADASGTTATAIPYYTWSNRGLAPMAVWVKDVQ